MRLIRLVLAYNWKYYSLAVLVFAAFWHVFSTISLFTQTEGRLSSSLRQNSAQFEASYLANDVFEAKRILWRICGEHVSQLVFRSSMPREQRVLFREVIVGDIPRAAWTQSRRSAPVVSNGAEIGRLEYAIDWLELNRFVLTQNAALFATVMVFVLGLLLLSNLGAIKTLFRMERDISELNSLVEAAEFDAIRAKLEDQAKALPAGGIGAPFAELAGRLVDAVRRASHLENELRVSKAVSGMAAQVAHDIRSPLAALDSVVKDSSRLPEEQRLMVRTAVGRIRDIANNLLEKERESKAGKSAALPAASEPAAEQLLSSLIDPLISEKRAQFRSKAGVEIEARLDAASYGLFAKVQPAEFKRVLSNLVNNSVEAMEDKGTVAVQLVPADGKVLLSVQDDAKGIPAEVLVRLGERGVTHGKAGGSGLGLHHAKTSVEAWGGRLSLASELGKGTTVSIELPKAQPPGWFVSRLELESGGTVVVLDDDASIHQVWQGRLDSAKAGAHGIEVLHFSTPAQLRVFFRENPAKARAALYLADYELAGHKETGLDLVCELGIGERSILVTSRSEEAGILAECRRLKVRMLPKGLAGFVPIAIRSACEETGQARQDGPDAVLLDDDALVRMNWTGTAKAKGLKVAAFHDIQEFLAAAQGLPKATAIYLDSKLGDGCRGEDIARDLHAKGFTNLYLTTGYERGSLPDMPWIKEVLGKAPPWG
jgi:signal transduction histidine kinase